MVKDMPGTFMSQQVVAATSILKASVAWQTAADELLTLSQQGKVCPVKPAREAKQMSIRVMFFNF